MNAALRRFAGFALAALLVAGCSKSESPTEKIAAPPKHEYKAPHGGAQVVLGNEAYRLELVREPANGKLSVYVLDSKMQNFARSTSPSLEVIATVDNENKTLLFNAVSDPATGEKVGDTALFETQADWLKTTREFDALLTKIEIHGTTFSGVVFNFPNGNNNDKDKDERDESTH